MFKKNSASDFSILSLLLDSPNFFFVITVSGRNSGLRYWRNNLRERMRFAEGILRSADAYSRQLQGRLR